MFYRLELTWYNWERYFDRPLMYTPERDIDRLHQHQLGFAVPDGQKICGLWLFEEPDIIPFWHTDPPGEREEKSRAAAYTIQAGGSGGGRFLVRIPREALVDGQLLPDLALRDERPTSCFHARSFDPADLDRYATGWVPTVYIDDHHVEVFYGGVWNRKTPEFGRKMVEDVLREGNMDKAIPPENFASCPSGSYQFPAAAIADVEEEFPPVKANWVSRIKSRIGL